MGISILFCFGRVSMKSLQKGCEICYRFNQSFICIICSSCEVYWKTWCYWIYSLKFSWKICQIVMMLLITFTINSYQSEMWGLVCGPGQNWAFIPIRGGKLFCSSWLQLSVINFFTASFIYKANNRPGNGYWIEIAGFLIQWMESIGAVCLSLMFVWMITMNGIWPIRVQSAGYEGGRAEEYISARCGPASLHISHITVFPHWLWEAFTIEKKSVKFFTL